MFILNDIKVSEHDQRTIGDTQYPPDWFLNPLERAKVGMIEVPDPVRPDDNLFISVENPDGSWTTTPRTAEDLAEIKFNKDTQQALFVRQTRNSKLKDSDYTQLPDSTVDKPLWAIYREELRNITNQIDFPLDIIWPIEPLAHVSVVKM